MAINRRQLLSWASGACAGTLLPAEVWAITTGTASWLSAYRDETGAFGIARVDASGRTTGQAMLPLRAHAGAAHPHRSLVAVVARRPGTQIWIIAPTEGRVLQTLHAKPGRHFYGHAIFTPDGKHLLTTENDYNGERGVVGVRRLQSDYACVGEVASGGIGPHELVASADGRSIIVANGGILTHPDSGRAKLNNGSMVSSLARLELGTLKIVDRIELPVGLRSLSIRHLAALPSGAVIFGMQDEGAPDLARPVLGSWHGAGDLRFWRRPRLWHSGYVGSVVLDSSSSYACASAPRDGRVGVFQVSDGTHLGDVTLDDACAVAAGAVPGKFIVATGEGRVGRISVSPAGLHVRSEVTTAGYHWDNHLLSLS